MQCQYRLNSILLSTLLVSVSLSLFSCAKSNDQIKQHDSAMERYQYTFTSVGYAPIAAQKGATFDVQMLNAIKASKLEAYKELAEQIYGVLLNAENSVTNASLQSDQIESRVQGLVRGARVLKSYHRGDIYITELELNMRSLFFIQAPEFNEKEMQVIQVEKQIYY
ncbi:LPP20 family lipoprotein [Psychromonas antarctica]|jgi:hypothetical protein|uniref:LPP20 family lipoprotein n=1 Tax=Psychromonas antarctica TaxID=67573 RepID=UPI001EE81F2E|nr:LPP20 family lipoprotein [Psychromonas antarctica]MCG6199762.1 LPP20 family lipoprotein [Psychromonas antarctica]